jgi:hypothetical protein
MSSKYRAVVACLDSAAHPDLVPVYTENFVEPAAIRAHLADIGYLHPMVVYDDAYYDFKKLQELFDWGGALNLDEAD